MKRLYYVTIILIIHLVFTIHADAVEFSIIDLGTLGGSQSSAYGINSDGSVVGYAQTSSGSYHAFRYDGTVHDLNTAYVSLGGVNNYATDINDGGYVTGYQDLVYTSANGEAFLYPRAFLTDGATVHNIDTLGGYWNQSTRINNSGAVTGYSQTDIPITDGGSVVGYEEHAFIYDGSTVTDLGTLGGGTKSYGWGINSQGHVAGYSEINVAGSDYVTHAFLYDGLQMIDLGTLGGTFSAANNINDSDHVVGDSQISNGTYHAFLYNGETMQDLGNLGDDGSAWSINNCDWVVGYSWTSGGEQHAFLHDGTMMYDLNDLVIDGDEWDYLVWAYDISDSNQIVGYGFKEGEERAFLLTPVPEPALFWLLIAGMACLGVSRHVFHALERMPL